ncbi:M20/M25/M40 family metallo-hydrolase (plasmid) [Cytobacillus oceanisediminis]|uniref:M20/M25/M40 family metallo-hydrolase n=1 Tax=Cytobacillus oceanisediminis TaxID=665099 RepID=UPI0018650E79|nr:M20/M25/M40 family metallo-hydrolase [Cytobacillus oceanisediminis]QOK29899.1 M20/M25/M40 family metallo-hydrolase [Cytobacillus oceanisediminis]
MKEVLKYIEENWDQHLKRYQKYVSQPSISGDGTGMQEIVVLLQDELKELGCQSVFLKETEGYPVIFGHLDEGQEKTILLYGMYDVQPVEGEEWMVDPFSGSVVELPDFGESIVSRGITNQKGPLAGFMNAVTAIKKVNGKLPVNLMFCLEGEEELGSVNLPKALDDLKDEFSKCDAVFFPHFSEDPYGKVELFLGSKGITHIELTCRGGDWGAPTSRGIHGSNAVWMENPAWHLVQALASLKDRDERILIEGFYDDVAEPWPGDEEIIDQMLKTFDEKKILKRNDVKKFKFGLSGKELLKRHFYSPELNINGVVSGHHGEGTKTLLPHEAKAKLDIRLVPNMSPEKVIDQVKNHLERYGFHNIKIDAVNAYNWARTSTKEPAMKALLQSFEDLGFEYEPWISMAGSAPFSLFQSKLGLPFAFGGLGHGARQHSPNEYATVEGMKNLEKSCVLFLDHYSKM